MARLAVETTEPRLLHDSFSDHRRFPARTTSLASVLVLICAACLQPYPCLAGSGLDLYYVLWEEVSDRVLKDAIGVLSITSRTGDIYELRTERRIDGGFEPATPLNIGNETTPVSHFGFHPPQRSAHGHRYPVVDTAEEHLEIAYEVPYNKRIWVSLQNLEEDFFVKLTMFDSIDVPSPFYVDIFFSSEYKKRTVFEEPKDDAKNRVLDIGQYGRSLIRVTDARHGFLKIGMGSLDYPEESIIPLGWIKLRDDKGRLAIWINMIDIY